MPSPFLIKIYLNYKPQLGLTLFTFLITLSAVAQPSGLKVLVVPLPTPQIHFDNFAQQILHHNQVSADSAVKYCDASSLDILTATLGKATCINIRTLKPYAYLADSLQEYTQFNSFHLGAKPISGASKKSNLTLPFNKWNYSGRILPVRHQLILKQCLEEHAFDYVILLNRFEIITPKPFDNKTHFSLHAEVYNNQLDKIFGHRSDVLANIARKTDYRIFKYLIRSASDELMISLLPSIQKK